MNAALSAFHMADWVWTTYHKDDPQKVADTQSPSDYSRYLADNGCPDFLVVKDVAEAHKHLKLDRGNPDDRVVTSAGATYLGSDGATTRMGLTGTPAAASKRLVVEQQDGTKRVFREVVENVIRMWEERIESEGL